MKKLLVLAALLVASAVRADPVPCVYERYPVGGHTDETGQQYITFSALLLNCPGVGSLTYEIELDAAYTPGMVLTQFQAQRAAMYHSIAAIWGCDIGQNLELLLAIPDRQ